MAQEYEQLKLENQLCFPLYACSRKIVGSYTPYLKPLGLTYTQYIVFMVLWEKESVNVGQLGETLCLVASPIYYFTMTAQMEAAIQRVYCIGKPSKAKKAALLLSSGSPGVYDSAVAQFKEYMAYAGIDIAGIITANGGENKSEAKLNEVKEFAKAL